MNNDIRPIESIRISGFASVGEAELELAPDVTLLIGANGSGKSNVIRSFELMAKIMRSGLQSYVLARGGMSNLLHAGERGRAPFVGLDLRLVDSEDSDARGYQVMIQSTDNDSAFLQEWLVFRDDSKEGGLNADALRPGVETTLVNSEHFAEGRKQFARAIQSHLAGIRVFHFDDVGPKAPPKTFSLVADNVSLHPDAGNLAAYLLRLKSELEDDYRSIVAAIRNVAPFFDDFVLEPEGPEGENVRLRWTQHNIDTVFGAAQLSDGTLRFICLATLLLSPHRPQCIVLDEPELGLHPYAVVQLAALLRKAANGGHQCVVATQSALLLDEFNMNNVAVLERKNGATKIHRPSTSQLEGFLSDYTLGEIWRMNILGGSPSFRETLS